MAPSKLPSLRRERFQIVDFEQARDYVQGVYGSVGLDLLDRKTPFEWSVTRASVGSLYIASSRFRGAVRFDTQYIDDSYFLFFSRKNCGLLRVGKDAPIVPGHAAAVGSPPETGELRFESDYRPLTIAIGRATLEGAFRALTGTSKQIALRFDPALSTSSGAGARIQRLVSFIVNELEHDDDALASSLVNTRYSEALMFEMLEGLAHNHHEILQDRARASEPRYVRQAAEWLEANAAEPVSMLTLSKVIGMSVRSLQAGFDTYRGCSPMAFLKERRLELARTRLLSAAPGATVAEIALDCGFSHLSRFSRLYEARFGELPSATIRKTIRARRRPAG